MKGECRILDDAGKVVFNSLSHEDEKLFLERGSGAYPSGKGKVRIGKMTDATGEILFASRDPDHVRSVKVFRAYLEVLFSSLDYFKGAILAVEERLAANSKRLVHNLTSLNGHMIQEIFSVISQDRLAGNIRRSIPLISGEMKGNRSNDFARCFLSLAKHSTAMKNEFSVFKKIDSLEASIEKRTHPIHKVVMNVAYLFFSDFADKGGYVNVAESNLTAEIDYECAFVALYHLFDNAAKYICQDTNLDVIISNKRDYISVELRMCSLAIAESELVKLTTEGFSGEISRKLQLNGDGVGLSLVERVMQLHGGRLIIDTDQKSAFDRDGIKFQKNSFGLEFPISQTASK